MLDLTAPRRAQSRAERHGLDATGRDLPCLTRARVATLQAGSGRFDLAFPRPTGRDAGPDPIGFTRAGAVRPLRRGPCRPAGDPMPARPARWSGDISSTQAGCSGKARRASAGRSDRSRWMAAGNMVRVVGVEPTLLSERVFETLASTIPPHPHGVASLGRSLTHVNRLPPPRADVQRQNRTAGQSAVDLPALAWFALIAAPGRPRIASHDQTSL